MQAIVYMRIFVAAKDISYKGGALETLETPFTDLPLAPTHLQGDPQQPFVIVGGWARLRLRQKKSSIENPFHLAQEKIHTLDGDLPENFPRYVGGT